MSSSDRRVPRINGLKMFEAAQRLRDAGFSMIAASGFASFGRGSRIMLPFRAGNPHKVAIGSQVLIGPSSWFMVPRLDAPGPVIHIGDRVRMNQTSISAVERVSIGEATALARGVYIADHMHGFHDPNARGARPAAGAHRTGHDRARRVARPERRRPPGRDDRRRRGDRREQRRDARCARPHGRGRRAREGAQEDRRMSDIRRRARSTTSSRSRTRRMPMRFSAA